MRKRKVQWLAAACVFCLAQPVWAATESTTVYQDQLDSVDQSYLGEILKHLHLTIVISVLYVVVKRQSLLNLQNSCRLVLMQIKCPIQGPLVMYMHKVM